MKSHFEISPPDDLKRTLNTMRSKLPHIYSPSIHRVSNFTPCALPTSFEFWATLWQSHWMTTNDLQHYICVYVVPHICIPIITKSQIPIRSTLWTAFFELQATLRQLHQVISKWPTASCFQVTGYFETRAPNALQSTLNTARTKVSHICYTNTPEFQVWVCFALGFSFQHICNFPSLIGHNIKFKPFTTKKVKYESSKFQEVTIVWTVTRSTHKMFGWKITITAGVVAF